MKISVSFGKFMLIFDAMEIMEKHTHYICALYALNYISTKVLEKKELIFSHTTVLKNIVVFV